MKNKTTLIIILFLVLIIIAAVLFITFKVHDKKDIMARLDDTITKEEVENLTDDQLREIFKDYKKYFFNFAGLNTNGIIPIFSASTKEEALELVLAVYGYEEELLQYVEENDLFFTFVFTDSFDPFDQLHVWKDSVYHTNFGLTEEVPEKFKNRDPKDKFINPTSDIIKKVYDTMYDESFYIAEHSTSKAIASFVEENDTEFIYTIFRLTGDNAIKSDLEYFSFEKITFVFDKASGVEKSFDYTPIRDIQI